jgi:hypothetical protein
MLGVVREMIRMTMPLLMIRSRPQVRADAAFATDEKRVNQPIISM